ncbi:MAG: hypothetical protein DHS20C16_09490 [Phycisphaerae bacterium]|nr:MAG: hypothetical protein DHS20C16_09490 [Phycisphaerae bacterium]
MRRRPAIALISVLVVTALIATLAATFIASTGTTSAISRNMEDHAKASQIAESGIRMTLAYIRAEENWRTVKSEGAWVTDASLSGGTFSITVNDGEDTDDDGAIANPAEGDGDLDDDDEDVFTITSIAKYAGTVYTARAVITPEGSSTSTKVLFVVPDKTNLSSQDDAKKVLMESWDFEVTLISANESQSAYDVAAAEQNVAYVSEEVSSSDVGTKFLGAPIGVVNEDNALPDELGIASSGTCYTSTSIDVIDNTHYITSGMSSGVVGILSGSSDLHVASGTLGGGTAILANQPSTSNAALVVIDTGGALYGGGTASARRVHLPWGCSSFDIDLLTDEGKDVLKRSLEWASQTPTVTSPTLHYDFDEQSGTAVNDREGSVDLQFVSGNGTLTWVNDLQGGTGLYFNQNAQSGTAACRTAQTTTADTFKSTLQASEAMTVQVFLKAEELDDSGGRLVTYSRDTGSATRNFSLMGGYTGSSAHDDLIGRAKNSSGSAVEYRQNDTWGMDEFHVLAMTIDHGTNSNNVKLYVDGVLVHTSSASGGDFDDWSSEHFLLGNEGTLDRPFRGTMFDVKIWDEALSSAQLYKNALELLPAADSDPQLIALYEFNEVKPDPQLIHHWNLDDVGATAVDGISGLDGTVNGATPGDPGVVGTAYGFDGSNDYIELPHNSSLMLSSGTISFWFSTTQPSSTMGLFSKDASGYVNGGHVHIYTESSRVKIRLQSDSASYTIQSGTIATKTTYHVVLTFGTSGMKLYMNGSEVDSDSYQGGLGSSSGGSGNTEPFVLGANTWGSGSGSVSPLQSHFSGTIDDVRVYDDALSAKQITNLYGLLPIGSYTGKGTIVKDTSAFGTALDLSVTDTSDVTWISGGGIELTSSTILESGVAATKLYNALTDTDEMTLECRFAPANTTQDGPARIVSYSSGTGNRNFTLGQEDFEIRQRVKTTSTNNNGMPDIESGSVLSVDTTKHVIVTYDGDNVKMYVDGSLETTTARTGTFNWNSGYELVMGNETSNDRPWLGKLFRVAIYDRALSSTQVDDVFGGNAPSVAGPEGWVYNAHWQELP